MSLAGKSVLITGGGSGLGADLARGFAAAGATVIIAGRRMATLNAVTSRLPGARAIAADVTSEASVAALFAVAGPCDIVIANAGMADSAPLTKTSLDTWNDLVATNLTGAFLTLRDGLAQMQGWGRLIAIASTAGVKGYPYVSAYTATKHGVVGLVRATALEVARRPITVNALCPGFLDTEMTDASVARLVATTGRTADQAREALAAANPQKRLIAPSEVTAAALWLCAAGSESVNGQAIVLSGGEV